MMLKSRIDHSLKLLQNNVLVGDNEVNEIKKITSYFDSYKTAADFEYVLYRFKEMMKRSKILNNSFAFQNIVSQVENHAQSIK